MSLKIQNTREIQYEFDIFQFLDVSSIVFKVHKYRCRTKFIHYVHPISIVQDRLKLRNFKFNTKQR